MTSDRDGRQCAWCGEVIGVYEPIMVGRDGRAIGTSLAAECQAPAGDLVTHEGCYQQRVDAGV